MAAADRIRLKSDISGHAPVSSLTPQGRAQYQHTGCVEPSREVSMRGNILGAVCAIAMITSANAAIKEEPITYSDGEATMKGFLVYDDANQAKRPGLIMVHEWWGIT